MEILIHRDGQNLGPYSPREVRDRIASGLLTRTDLAWYEGLPGWVPLAELRLPPDQEAALAVVPPRAPATTPAPAPLPVAVPTSTRTCPFCAEPIKNDALKCRHCGEILDPRLRAAEESKRASEHAIQMAAARPQQAPNQVNVKVNTVPHMVVVHRRGTSCFTWGCLILVLGFGLIWLVGILARVH